MTDIAKATNAPLPVTIAGREWRLSRLTLRDIGALDTWTRAQVIASARESLPPDATPQERDDTLRAAVQAAAPMAFFQGGDYRLADSAMRIPRLLMQMLRRCHPEVTFDVAEGLMAEDPEGVKTALDLARAMWSRAKKAEEPATGAAAAPAASPQST